MKRFLSIALALAMVIGFLPGAVFDADTVMAEAATAATTYSGVNYSYLFTVNSYSDMDTLKIEKSGTITGQDIAKYKYNDYGDERPYGIVSTNASRVDSKGYRFSSIENFMDTCAGKNGEYIAFKVKVPAAGAYKIDVSGYEYANGGIAELYMLPYTSDMTFYNIKNNLGTYANSNTKVASANFYGKSKTVVKRTNVGTFVASDALDYSSGHADYLMIVKSVKSTNNFYVNLAGIYLRGQVDIKDVVTTPKSSAIAVGASTSLSTSAKTIAGAAANLSSATVSYAVASGSESIIQIGTDGKSVIGLSEGTGEIITTVTINGGTHKKVTEIKVQETSPIAQNGITVEGATSVIVYTTTQLKLKATTVSGKSFYIPSDLITWIPKGGTNTNAVTISKDGVVTADGVGSIILQPAVDAAYLQSKGAADIRIAPVTLNVIWDSANAPDIYTTKERENAKSNTEKYSWAKDEVDGMRSRADVYADNVDKLYNLIVAEGLPRYYHVGHKYDPLKFCCRYCGCNISSEYNAYGWLTDAMNDPWKIQCPDCKRRFPSNDFEGFYNLGLSDSGSWDLARALQRHHEMFVCESGANCTHTPVALSQRGTEAYYTYYGYGVAGGYLTNDLYPELNDARWGVDDSRGYLQKYVSSTSSIGYNSAYSADANGNAKYKNGPVQHTYIAYYIHEGLWYGKDEDQTKNATIRKAIKALSEAFVHTGDAKYGRAGAILLDRIADYWKDFNWYQWRDFRGDTYNGTIVDAVWSTDISTEFGRAYDAFQPIYNDPYVVEYLKTYGARHAVDANGNWDLSNHGSCNHKISAKALRNNVERNLLKDIFTKVKQGRIWGNPGMAQASIATAALALNVEDSNAAAMLDWIMATPAAGKEGYNTGGYKYDIGGGGISELLINQVNRDGIGNENAPHYNSLWITNFMDVADVLAGTDRDLYKNPKFAKMFSGIIRLTIGGNYTPQTGDTGGIGTGGLFMDKAATLKAFEYTKDPLLAQALYLYNGNSVKNLYGSILSDDPASVQTEIKRVIDRNGQLALESDMLTGYGFAALRSGKGASSPSTNRDISIYFGANSGHGHIDTLNLFMSAYGLNIAPDLGYPEQTGLQPNRYEWVRTTLSHNTVLVNNEEQNMVSKTGVPYHFDDDGRVKVMDVRADVYDTTEDYRRTVFMIDVDDEISYGIDFFHVRGGTDHLYSFHSQSDEITAIEGLSGLTMQPTYKGSDGEEYGTYAGANVKFGPDPVGHPIVSKSTPTYKPLGSTWLKNIRKYSTAANKFAVEFKVKDFNDVLTENRDIRLRLTMLNDDKMEEVTFASAYVPKTELNNKTTGLEYLLVRNKVSGGTLNTTFTTVLEPYTYGDRYIKNIEKVKMVRTGGSGFNTTDAYGAVKVTLEDGRVDYIMYSTNNGVIFNVGDKFTFRGFAGVVTLDADGNVTYKYLNDGDTLAKVNDVAEAKLPAYTGTIKSFTQELTSDNYITVKKSADAPSIDPEVFAGKYVYITNSGTQNGVYKIKSAQEVDGFIELYLGDVSLITSYKDPLNPSSGYIYNMAVGNALRIPLNDVVDESHDSEAGEQATNIKFAATVSAGGSISTNVSDYTAGSVVSVERGTPVTVTANDVDGKMFRGWYRGGENGVIVSLNKEYSFTAMTNISLYAKYTDVVTEEIDEYYSWTGEFLAMNEKPETAPEMLGYTFTGEWEKAVDGLITRWVAQYVQADTTYEIITPSGTQYKKYDELVELTSPTAVSWYRDGVLVDYGTSYSFYVTGDTKVTKDSKTEDGVKAKLDKNGDVYILEYDAGAGNTIVEAGILLGNNTSITIDSTLSKAAAQRKVSHGQFSVNRANYAAAVGYVIYNDGTVNRVFYTK